MFNFGHFLSLKLPTALENAKLPFVSRKFTVNN